MMPVGRKAMILPMTKGFEPNHRLTVSNNSGKGKQAQRGGGEIQRTVLSKTTTKPL